MGMPCYTQRTSLEAPGAMGHLEPTNLFHKLSCLLSHIDFLGQGQHFREAVHASIQAIFAIFVHVHCHTHSYLYLSMSTATPTAIYICPCVHCHTHSYLVHVSTATPTAICPCVHCHTHSYLYYLSMCPLPHPQLSGETRVSSTN